LLRTEGFNTMGTATLMTESPYITRNMRQVLFNNL
jgi:hypothetical protein